MWHDAAWYSWCLKYWSISGSQENFHLIGIEGKKGERFEIRDENMKMLQYLRRKGIQADNTSKGDSADTT